MAQGNFDLGELERRMRAAVDALKRELSGLRTGRASANLLDPVIVNVYGQKLPLNQVGSVSVPEPRMLTVQVWDKAAVPAEKAKPGESPKPQARPAEEGA